LRYQDRSLKRRLALLTCKRQPAAPIAPHKEWMEKEASEKEGLAAAAGALADFDADIDEMIEAVYAARAKAKDREVLL
jgi:hypothetical protein